MAITVISEERKQDALMMANQWKKFKPNSQKSSPKGQNLVLDAIAKLKGEKSVSKTDKGVVRMKLVVKKEDLKKMSEEVLKGRSDDKKQHSLHLSKSFNDVSFTLEQRLILWWKQQSIRLDQEKGQSPWKPILQSIPEEL